MKKSSAKGHSFPKGFGFTGSCSDAGSKRYVAGYFRGGPVKHEDEAQDRQLIRREIKKALKAK
jgi:hypothetical protein